MDFHIRPEQRRWQQQARMFAQKRLAPLKEHWESDPSWLSREFRQARTQGIIDSKALLQGRGDSVIDLLSAALITCEFAKAEAGFAIGFVNYYLCCRAVSYLSDVPDGERLRTLLERPESPFGVTLVLPNCVANPPCDSEVEIDSARNLNVRESLVPASQEFMLLAGQPVGRGHWSPTLGAFLVSADSGRFVCKEAVPTIGLRSIPFLSLEWQCDVNTPGVIYIPVELNAHPLLERFATERQILMAAALSGVIQSLFDYAFAYSQSRIAFRKPLIQHQAITLKLSDMAIALEVAQLLLLEAIVSAGMERPNLEFTRNAWTYIYDVGPEVGLGALQLMGGHGYLTDHPVEKWLRDMETLRLIS